MAEVITEWPSIMRNSTRKSRYPWNEWTDGQIRKVVAGEDFESTLKTFVQGLYAYAKRNGYKVEVRQDTANDAAAFRFIPKGEVGFADEPASVE